MCLQSNPRQVCRTKSTWKCPLCPAVVSSKQRLQSHARAAHRIDGDSQNMGNFAENASNINRSGQRRTSASKVAQLMGPYSQDPHIVQMCHRLLKEHHYAVEGDAEDHGGAGTVPVTSPNFGTPAVIRPLERSHPPPHRNLTPGRGSRRMTTAALSASRILPDFKSKELCSLAELYLETKSVQSGVKSHSVLRTAQCLHRFIAFAQQCEGFQQTTDQWTLVTRLTLADLFVKELRQVFRPMTVLNHAKDIHRFLEETNSSEPLSSLLPADLKQDHLRATVHWKKLCKTEERNYRAFQRARVTAGAFVPASFKLIRQYLRDESVLGKLESALRSLEAEFVLNGEITAALSNSWLHVTRFLIVSVLEQGQRLCVLQNLTLEEFNSGKLVCSKFVLRINNHKTSTFFGPASLILDGATLFAWQRYCALRTKLATPSQMFLLTPSCQPIAASALSPLNQYLNQRGAPAVNFSDVRKSIETLTQLYSDNASHNETRAAVQQYLCHGAAVTSSHYRYRTDSVLLLQAKCVKSVIDQSLLKGVVWELRDEILPSSGYDPFPSRRELHARLVRCSPDPVTVDTITPFAYDEICKEWLREMYPEVLASLRAAVPHTAGAPAMARAKQLRDLLSKLGPIWSDHITDFEIAIL